MAYICPRCDGDMAIRHIGNTQVERCEQCNAIYLDVGEFNKVINVEEGNLEFCIQSDDEVLPDEQDGVLSCIKCPETPLRKVELLSTSGIYIDRCDDCAGIWLDGGEQKAIQAYLDKPSTASQHPMLNLQSFIFQLTSMFS